jgi:succinate-acetate transporter protein
VVHIESETGTSSAAVGTQPQVADPTAYIADPGPLGLAGFAMTTVMVSQQAWPVARCSRYPAGG